MRRFLEIFHTRTLSPTSHFLLTLIILTPTVLYRFQNHHDGYVLQTSRLFKLALQGGSEYPFSQYGPLWSLILGLSGFVFPDDFLLLGIRVVSVLACAFAIYLSAKISLIVVGRSIPLSLTLFFIATWYFFGPYYGWPSIFLLPFALTMCLLLAKTLVLNENARFTYFYIGFCIGMIQNLKVQVGILLILTFLLLQFLFETKKAIPRLIAGYSISLLIMFLFLFTFDMFTEAVYDQYYFAFKFHLTSDRAATRVPYWTILIALTTFLLLYVVLVKFRSRFAFAYLLLLWSSISILIIFSWELLFSNHGLQFFHWRIIQRLYVGMLLGVVVFVLYRISLLVRNSSLEFGRYSSTEGSTKAIISIAAISLCVYSQVYPLFSSHHTWYSSLPILLTFSLLPIFTIKRGTSKVFLKSFVVLMVTLLVYTFNWHFTNIDFGERSINGQNILISRTDNRTLINVRAFLDLTIPKNSRVHNLCPDPTIFQLRRDLMPASRLSIWWDNFDRFESYLDLIDAPSDFFIVCSQTIVSPTVGEIISQKTLNSPIATEWDFYIYDGRISSGYSK